MKRLDGEASGLFRHPAYLGIRAPHIRAPGIRAYLTSFDSSISVTSAAIADRSDRVSVM